MFTTCRAGTVLSTFRYFDSFNPHNNCRSFNHLTKEGLTAGEETCLGHPAKEQQGLDSNAGSLQPPVSYYATTPF